MSKIITKFIFKIILVSIIKIPIWKYCIMYNNITFILNNKTLETFKTQFLSLQNQSYVWVSRMILTIYLPTTRRQFQISYWNQNPPQKVPRCHVYSCHNDHKAHIHMALVTSHRLKITNPKILLTTIQKYAKSFRIAFF